MQNEPQLSAELRSIAEYLGCNEGEFISEVSKLLATALEEQKMKTEVETGLKNFQVTMEEIAKARADERQAVIKEIEERFSIQLETFSDSGDEADGPALFIDGVLIQNNDELRAKLVEMKEGK